MGNICSGCDDFCPNSRDRDKRKERLYPQGMIEKRKLTFVQKNALQIIDNQSRIYRPELERLVPQAFKRQNFTLQFLKEISQYVSRHAPIIIHVNLNRNISNFLKDTHYRNQFQTDHSEQPSPNINLRKKWENKLFSNAYAECKDVERVKYGVLNFCNDPKGVHSCTAYGDSYFVLSNKLSNSCTLTSQDSCNDKLVISTLEHNYKVLFTFQVEEIYAIEKAKKRHKVSSSEFQGYKEVQIHGPLLFKRDFYQLVVSRFDVPPDSEKNKLVQKFCRDNRIELRRF